MHQPQSPELGAELSLWRFLASAIFKALFKAGQTNRFKAVLSPGWRQRSPNVADRTQEGE